MSSPFFPLDVLKLLMMENLTEAVRKGAAHIRDPIGGSNETLFVYASRTLDRIAFRSYLLTEMCSQVALGDNECGSMCADVNRGNSIKELADFDAILIVRTF